MIFETFQAAFAFLISHGYFVFLIIMIIEGPIVNTVAAFASSLGYFNVWIIFLLAVLGDLIGDLIYFYIGKFGRAFVLDKYGHHVGLTKERTLYIEKNLHKHFLKTLLIVKLTPFLASAGLIIVGASKVKVLKFIFGTLLITIPTCIFFTTVGYYFGLAIGAFVNIFKNVSIIIIGVILLVIAAPYVYKLVASRIAKV